MVNLGFKALKNVPSGVYVGLAVLVVGGVAYIALKKPAGQPLPEALANRIAGSIAGAISDAIGGAVSGVVEGVAPKIAPWSNRNIIYEDIIGGIGRSTGGGKDFTLGGWIYDITH